MSETDKIKDMIPNSSLTERQLEIILHWKNKNNIKIPNEKRKIKPKISKGSYYRILNQGKQNIKKINNNTNYMYIFRFNRPK